MIASTVIVLTVHVHERDNVMELKRVQKDISAFPYKVLFVKQNRIKRKVILEWAFITSSILLEERKSRGIMNENKKFSNICQLGKDQI